MENKFTFSESNEKIDRRISGFVVAYYVVEALNMAIKSALPVSDQLWSAMSNGFIAMLAILMLFSIRPVLRRAHKSFFLVELFMTVLFLISFLQGNAQRSLLMQTAFETLFVSVPIAFYVVTVKDKQIFYDAVLKVSYFLIPMLVFVFFMNRHRPHYYQMSVSYALLLPGLFQLNEFIKKRSFLNLLFSITAVLSITLYGARGPLLSVGGLLIMIYLLGSSSTAKKIIIGALGFASLAIILLYWEPLTLGLTKFLESRGIYSRTLYALLRGSIFELSGRDRLWAHYLELARSKPFFGWGINGGYIAAGSGPHNMLVGYLLAFGYIGGGILGILSIGSMLRVFFIRRSVLQELMMIYCARNIGLFFVSGGFLTNVNWLIFVGLVLSSFKNSSKMLFTDEHNKRRAIGLRGSKIELVP